MVGLSRKLVIEMCTELMPSRKIPPAPFCASNEGKSLDQYRLHLAPTTPQQEHSSIQQLAEK